MKLNQLLQQQLHVVYNKKEWLVSLTDALDGLTPEQAAVKIPGENHSIKELVIHLLFWTEWYWNRFRGTSAVPADQSNEYTFTVECLGAKNITWDSILERLYSVLSEWQKELEDIKEDKLFSTISNSDITWLGQISNLILHISYHTGQIVCLRKIQNNWDSSKGVK